MDFVLSPNENVAFKHNAIYNKQEGCLYITNLRISWVPFQTGLEVIVISMGDILKDQYSPATDQRVMFRVTRVSTNTAAVFLLIGSDTVRCRKELEKVKSILKQIRSGDSSSMKTDQSIQNGHLSGQPTSSQSNKERNSNNRTKKIINTNQEYLRRQNILNTHDEIRKQFIELVKESNLLEENEFWESRKHMLSEREAADCASRKGALSVLHSDTQAVDRDGKLLIQITPEIVQHIFDMYPAVEKAYQSKVPDELTETEFWMKYYQSEYFSRDKGIKPSSGSSGYTDDMFARFETPTTSSQSSKYSSPSVSGKQEVSGQTEVSSKKRRLTEVTHKDVDITTSLNDLHSRRYDVHMSEVADDLPTATAVVQKYNRNSQLVMEKQTKGAQEMTLSEDTGSPGPVCGRTASSVSVSVSASTAQTSFMSELQEEKAPDYISLRLSHHHSKLVSQQSESSGVKMKMKTASPPDDRPSEAFGKALSSPSIIGASSVSSILNSIDKCFPSAEQAASFLITANKSLQDLGTDTENQADNTRSGISATEKALPEHFKQLMFEKYSMVTELLRHFYAILSRDGIQAPIPGSEAAKKVTRILFKLDEQLDELGKQRKHIQEKSREDKSGAATTSSTCMLRSIKQVSDLIHRAVDKWDKYSERLAGQSGAGTASANTMRVKMG